MLVEDGILWLHFPKNSDSSHQGKVGSHHHGSFFELGIPLYRLDVSYRQTDLEMKRERERVSNETGIIFIIISLFKTTVKIIST